MKTMLNYLLYTFYALMGAAVYGYMAYILIYPQVSEGRIFVAHVLNISLIIFMLIMDKIEQNMMCKRIAKTKKSKFSVLLRIAFLGHISSKTSVYFFYIFVLTLSVILQADTAIEFTDNFQQFIITLDYGILFLIAADVFSNHLKIDIKRVQDIDNETDSGNRKDK